MCYFLRNTCLLDCRDAVAAADDAHRVGRGDLLGNGDCALRELFKFIDTERSVPDYRFGGGNLFSEYCNGLGADVQPLPTVGNPPAFDDLCFGFRMKRAADDIIYRENGVPGKFISFHERFRDVKVLCFNKRIPNGQSGCGEERVCHAAADEEAINGSNQVLNERNFVRYLRPSEDDDIGPFGIIKARAEVVDFTRHQETGGARVQIVRHAFG